MYEPKQNSPLFGMGGFAELSGVYGFKQSMSDDRIDEVVERQINTDTSQTLQEDKNS